MVLALPGVRLLEAGLRFAYLRDLYPTIWDGLTRDIWFSAGWQAYVKTPLGLSMTILPILLVIGALGCFLMGVRRGRTGG